MINNNYYANSFLSVLKNLYEKKMSANLQVESLTKQQLLEAYKKNRFWKRGRFNALSKNKVLWILNAPRIDDHDFCFFLGIANDEIVSFISVIPDAIKTKADHIKKIYWMTEWWVNDTYKKTVLPTYLFMESLKFTKNNILIKAYAQNAHDFYSKQPFQTLLVRTRFTTFFGLNPDSIIGQFNFLKHSRFLLNIANTTVKNTLSYLNSKKNSSRTKEVSYEYLTQLDAESWAFIQPNCSKDIIYKTKDYIDWQLDSKQYVKTPVAKKFNLKTQIRGYSEAIDLFNIKVVKNDIMIGFISFLNYDKEFYLKYFLSDDENFDTVVAALMEHLLKLKASHLFTENEKVIAVIKKRYLTTFTHAAKKTALAHNELFKDLKSIDIQEQDGHFI